MQGGLTFEMAKTLWTHDSIMHIFGVAEDSIEHQHLCTCVATLIIPSEVLWKNDIWEEEKISARERKYARYGKTNHRKDKPLYTSSVIFFSIPENTKN